MCLSGTLITRQCPIEINFSEDDSAESQWRCDVYLSKTYAYMPDGKPGARYGSADDEPPQAPWIRQDPEDQHFAAVPIKGEVGDVIRRAQLAILNPGIPPDRYKPGATIPPSESLQVKFSPNCVRVEVSIASSLFLSCC